MFWSFWIFIENIDFKSRKTRFKLEKQEFRVTQRDGLEAITENRKNALRATIVR